MRVTPHDEIHGQCTRGARRVVPFSSLKVCVLFGQGYAAPGVVVDALDYRWLAVSFVVLFLDYLGGPSGQGGQDAAAHIGAGRFQPKYFKSHR